MENFRQHRTSVRPLYFFVRFFSHAFFMKLSAPGRKASCHLFLKTTTTGGVDLLLYDIAPLR